ncbi:MAG: zinc ribbon domain-containing protein [Elainellaceae cyanobacterium]
MQTCPRCQQSVDSNAIDCPYCRNPLKAFGHPGIPLYQATDDDYLCQTCVYDEDDTCNFPQRPYAKQCTLYQDRSKQDEIDTIYRPSFFSSLKSWMRRNSALIVLAGLVVISILIALS